MHLYLLTRGIKHDVDRFINDLQAQYLPYGKTKALVQLGVRPIQLWEMVFSSENLPVVLKTIGWNGNQTKHLPKYLSFLRKPLKAKKLPNLDLKDVIPRPIYKNNVGLTPIGIKEDKVWTKELAKETEKKLGAPCMHLVGEEML